jgi:hypothetical protein
MNAKGQRVGRSLRRRCKRPPTSRLNCWAAYRHGTDPARRRALRRHLIRHRECSAWMMLSHGNV